MTGVELLLGDCRVELAKLADASIDAVVCDPPYELGFMGRSWDSAGVSFQPETWAKILRVLKPGGHLLAFGGTRTVHRIAVAIEDGGFEIRDMLCWMYGSGFPKSRNLDGDHAGWGTALKPAFEPIILARKPFAGTVAENMRWYGVGALNVDACRIEFVSPEDEEESKQKNRYGDFETPQGGNAVYGDYSMLEPRENYDPPGRWPANVVLSHTVDCILVGEGKVKGDGNWSGSTESVGYEGGWDTTDHPRDQRVPQVETVEVWECAPDCPVRLVDEQTADLGPSQGTAGGRAVGTATDVYGRGWAGAYERGEQLGYGDVGGASRFFYCAKTSRAERNAGLDATFEERDLRWSAGDQSLGTFQGEGTDRSARNHHPTVKPIELMRWLLRLVTPPDGVVLDPFLGSGSTGCAAILEPTVGRFVGVERESDYLAISRARIAFWQEHGEGALEVVRMRSQSEERRREIADAGQLDLLG